VDLTLHKVFLEEVADVEGFLVGCSGGRDSVALVLALREAGFKNVVLAHVNYGLRGEDSEGDERFVCELGERLGMEVVVERAGECPRNGVEEWARELRMRFFERVVSERGLRGVVLGHHADDQAETVLFNLCRGGAGLRGMKVLNERGGMGLFRPLLGCRRDELTAFLEERGESWREDATNAGGGFTRNRFRHEVLPLLVEVMGREVVPQMTRATEVAMEEGAALEEFLAGLDLYDLQGRLFLPKVQMLSAVLQKRVLVNFLRKKGVSGLDGDTVERCCVLLKEEETAKVNLPGGRYLRRKEKRLFVE